MKGTRSFGELLRGHRQAAGMTMEELSEISGVSVRAIGDMERGRSKGPQRRTVAALADALDLAPADRETLDAAAKTGRPRSVTTPGGGCELPRAVGDFAGRRAELAWLEDLAGEAADDGPAVAATISGGPGLGKTTLVVRAAMAMAGRFPDGQFFLDLRGMDDSPLSPGSSLSVLLKAFGVADDRIPHEEKERAGFYRSVLGRRRSLVVLDNAAGESQVRPLLPGGGNSLVLITSRRSLAGLEDVRQLPLPEMPPDDAVQMLKTIVHADGDLDDFDVVAGLCGHLPLAIRIAGNRLLSRPGWTAAQMAGRLADEERRLETLSAGDLHVAAAFAVSYRHLPTPTRGLFRRLALVAGPEFGAATVAVLAGIGLEDAEDALEDLVELGLLQSPHVTRYRLHDLVKLYARARLAEEDPEDERRAAAQGLNDWLLDVATAAGRWFDPSYGEPPQEPIGPVHLDSPEQAHAWLETEGANWLAALRSAAAQGQHARVVEVAEAMHWFSDRLAHWSGWREVFEMSSRAAHALGDLRAEAVDTNHLAWALSNGEGRHEDSVQCALRAHELARAAQDLDQQAWALQYAGIASLRLPESERAATYLRQAIDLFKAAGDWDGYPQAAGAYGDCLRSLGRLDDALRQHVSLLDELNAPDYPGSPSVRNATVPMAISAIGVDHAALGNWREAADCLREAIPLLRTYGPLRVKDRNQQLGVALRELGDIDGARKAFEDALADYLAVGDDRVDEVRKMIADLDR